FDQIRSSIELRHLGLLQREYPSPRDLGSHNPILAHIVLPSSWNCPRISCPPPVVGILRRTGRLLLDPACSRRGLLTAASRLRETNANRALSCLGVLGSLLQYVILLCVTDNDAARFLCASVWSGRRDASRHIR